MDSPSPLQPGRFILAIAGSTTLVVSAPFIGFVRSWIRTTFPGQFVRIVGSAIAVLAIVAVIAAVRRIRTHRVLRYTAIVTSLACASWYSIGVATGNQIGRAHD